MEVTWAAPLTKEAPCEQDFEPQQEYSSQGSRPSGLAKSQIYQSNLICSSIYNSLRLPLLICTDWRQHTSCCLLSTSSTLIDLCYCCCLEERKGQNVALMASRSSSSRTPSCEIPTTPGPPLLCFIFGILWWHYIWEWGWRVWGRVFGRYSGKYSEK